MDNIIPEIISKKNLIDTNIIPEIKLSESSAETSENENGHRHERTENENRHERTENGHERTENENGHERNGHESNENEKKISLILFKEPYYKSNVINKKINNLFDLLLINNLPNDLGIGDPAAEAAKAAAEEQKRILAQQKAAEEAAEAAAAARAGLETEEEPEISSIIPEVSFRDGPSGDDSIIPEINIGPSDDNTETITEVIPDGKRGIITEVVPDGKRGIITEVVPDGKRGIITEVVPDGKSGIITEVVPDGKRGIITEVVPDGKSGIITEVVPDGKSGIITEVVPDGKSGIITEVVPDGKSGIITDVVPSKKLILVPVEPNPNRIPLGYMEGYMVYIYIDCNINKFSNTIYRDLIQIFCENIKNMLLGYFNNDIEVLTKSRPLQAVQPPQDVSDLLKNILLDIFNKKYNGQRRLIMLSDKEFHGTESNPSFNRQIRFYKFNEEVVGEKKTTDTIWNYLTEKSINEWKQNVLNTLRKNPKKNPKKNTITYPMVEKKISDWGKDSKKELKNILKYQYRRRKFDFPLQILRGGSKKKSKIIQKKNKKIYVRKHKGIYQSGNKLGQLKPGYKYSSEKIKSGLFKIKKI
jgi:hypothetical protein